MGGVFDPGRGGQLREKPVGREPGFRVEEPGVRPAADVARWGDHHVATLAADVDVGRDLAGGVLDGEVGDLEEVLPAAAGLLPAGVCRKVLARGSQLFQGLGAVYIQYEDAGGVAGADPDVRFRPAVPPAHNLPGVRGGVVQPVLGARVLAGALAVGAAAAAATVSVDAVEGEHLPTSGGVGEGGVEECALAGSLQAGAHGPACFCLPVGSSMFRCQIV